MLRTHRLTVVAAATVLALATSVSSASAQDTTSRRRNWDVLISSGKLLPTGMQRDAIQSGDHTALRVARALTSTVAMTTTVGWTRRHNLAAAAAPYLTVFMLDVGPEVRTAQPIGRADGFALSPFAGAGLGTRSYSAQSVSSAARYNVAGYVGAGSEIGAGRIRVRLEARNYVSGFRAFDGSGNRTARNDVVVLAGLRIGKP
jgi:hypothetical protein